MRHVWIVEIKTGSKWEAVWWMGTREEARVRARLEKGYLNLPSRTGPSVRVVKYIPEQRRGQNVTV